MCDVSRCKRPYTLLYEAFEKKQRVVEVCVYHWEKHCDDKDKFDLRSHFYPTQVAKKSK